MHALVVRVAIEDPDAALRELQEQTVPRVSQAPGFVSGYWTRKDNTGLAMIVFESEDAARAASERIRAEPPAEVNVEDAELREVVARA